MKTLFRKLLLAAGNNIRRIAVNKNYDKLVKVMQIISIVFIAVGAVAGIVLMKKYNISVKNAAEFKEMLSGNVLKVALIIILVNFVKSFALFITPSITFVVCGIVFENIWTALLVSVLSIATSIAIPYYIGRFAGNPMAEKLKNKYPKMRKIMDVADDNGFAVVFLVKATGLIPSDTSSMLFGAMDIGFKRFFIATNLGEIPIILLWVLLGHNGNFSDPKTALYIIPIIVFAVVASVFMKKWTDKKSKEKEAVTTNRKGID